MTDRKPKLFGIINIFLKNTNTFTDTMYIYMYDLKWTFYISWDLYDEEILPKPASSV